MSLTPYSSSIPQNFSTPLASTGGVLLHQQDLTVFTLPINEKMKDFMGLIHKKLSSENSTNLEGVIRHVGEEKNELIKSALFKKESYFVRLFSKESWEEWTENRTSLGKLISIFSQSLQNFPVAKTIERLDINTIRLAEIEAAKIMKEISLKKAESSDESESRVSVSNDCSLGLAFGFTGSLATSSPLPVALGAFNCLSHVRAEKFNDHITLEPGQTWMMDTGGKIRLCKKNHANPKVCDYHGKPMHVSIIKNNNDIIYNGPFNSDQTFDGKDCHFDIFTQSKYCAEYRITITVTNDTPSQSAMYVYVD